MTSQTQPMTSQHQQLLSHHQLMTSQPQQMTSQQLLQQQILLRQLKPGAAQPPSSPSPTLQHNPPQPKLAPRNQQPSMSMVKKPVLMADQQLNSYTRTTASNGSLQQMQNSHNQASMGNNQQQINVSYPSQQLPQKSPALTSAALSQLAAASAQKPTSIQQLSKQALSLQQQQEQLQQILEQQQRIKDEEIMLAKLQGVRMDTQTPQVL